MAILFIQGSPEAYHVCWLVVSSRQKLKIATIVPTDLCGIGHTALLDSLAWLSLAGSIAVLSVFQKYCPAGCCCCAGGVLLAESH